MKDDIMTTEQKTKAYDEALVNGSRLWECGEITRENYEYIFPELKESEDDKIRKYIINHFQGHLDTCKRFTNDGMFPPFSATEIEMLETSIAWLEKQGTDISLFSNEQQKYMKKYISLDKITLIKLLAERDRNVEEITKSFEMQEENNMGISESTKQKLEDNLHKALEKETPESCNEFLEKQDKRKLVDKVEVLFKPGDWITNGELLVGQVVSFDGDYYHYIANGIEQPLHISNAYKWHRWTIKDAKDGDVLHSGQITLLFKQWEDNTDCNFIIAYAGIDVSNKLQITNKHWLLSNDCKPATKEQYDLLFSEMKEAGYEWDADKKELKKIEQNFSEYEKPLLENFKKAVYDCAWEKVTCKVEGESKEEYANRWAEQLLMLVRDWADDYIDSREDAIRRHSFDKGKQSMQKSAWSEEDSTKFNATIAFLKNPYLIKDNEGLRDKTIEWLQLLKERVKN